MVQDDGLTSFFFYILFVYPVTSWFLKPGRFSKRQGVTYAIAFLTVLACIKTGHEIIERGDNYYKLLQVGRSGTPLEIKKAYKKQSLELHPDKSKSPTATEDFARLKDAYDTLMDPDLRETYNKFGPEGIKNNRRASDEVTMLIEIAVYYATWGMLAYVLTLGKTSSLARSWIFTGQIVMLISEVSLMLTGAQDGSPLPSWPFPYATEHEVVLVLHSLFPAYLNGCRCLGGFLYVDVEEQMRQRVEEVKDQNKDILMVLRDIQVNLQSLQARRAALQQQAQGSSSDDAPPPHPPHPSGLGKATPTGKVREMEEKLRQQRERGGVRGVTEAKPAAQAPQKGVNVWWMVGLFILFHFFFNNSSSN